MSTDKYKTIRHIVRSILKEAFETPHFNDRLKDRFLSKEYTKPVFDYSKIKPNLDIVRMINFDNNLKYAVQVGSMPVTHVSKDPETGTVVTGSEVWVPIRFNEIGTIFLRKRNSPFTDKANVDYVINLKQLKNIYDNGERNENGTIDYSRPVSNVKAGTRKKVDLDLPTIDIGGKLFYIDSENEEIIYTKNIKRKVSFNDVSEEVLEKIIDVVV